MKKITNIALVFLLLVVVALSFFINKTRATAPNPGHNYSEVGGGVAQGDILYGSAADTLSVLPKSTTATRYLSNGGTNNNPTWSQVSLVSGVTGILTPTYGGTGSAYFAVTGPASSVKTFTFPDANATVLTSYTPVTVAQGGTGGPPSGDDQVLVSDGVNAATWRTVNDCQGTGKALTYTQSSNTWGCNTISTGGSHTLLDGSTHTDTTAGTVARGDIITGQGSTPSWTRLAKGTANQVLAMDSSGTDITWKDATTSGYTLSVQALTSSPTDAQTVYFGQLPKAPMTSSATSRVYIPRSGTVKNINIYVYSGTAGTNESWSLYFRYNNTTDTLIKTVSAATSERVFSSSSMNIAVTAGSYFEIKGVQPTWATNPATTIYGGYVYIE